MSKVKSLRPGNVKVRDVFWNQYIDLVAKEIIPFQWRLINDEVCGAEKSYCLYNFRVAAGMEKGAHKGEVFQDTDVAKWLEAVAYVLECDNDFELEKTADETIELIAHAQCSDGYLNTYYHDKPNERWSDLFEGHELYNAGHMIEAAVAYTQATGKRRFLDVVCKMADNICNVFGNEEGKLHGYPGHPEIELAIVRLYKLTGNKKYIELAKYFIDIRGKQPSYFKGEINYINHTLMFPEFADFEMDYCQADCPVSEQRKAKGHAVRAVYLYSAMADLAYELNDVKMLEQCKAIWDNITECQMYITGSIGSAAFGERFTIDYDLPNDTNYSESCATVGLIMFSHRMFQLTCDGKYMDVVEKALYNTLLSGIALDGKHFFYVNPLEVVPEVVENNLTFKHISTSRQPWFGVACCPTNIARTLASIGKYMFSVSDDTFFINLYIAGDVKVPFGANFLDISIYADYPNSGRIEINIHKACDMECSIALRIPEFSKEHYKVSLNDVDLQIDLEKGYLYLKRIWNDGDVIILDLDVAFQYMYCNPFVRSNIGKVCIMKGPWVYCLEEIDNGKYLDAIAIDTSEPICEFGDKERVFGCSCAKLTGTKVDCRKKNRSLYYNKKNHSDNMEFRAIPYCIWNNRGKGEMKVWMRDMTV